MSKKSGDFADDGIRTYAPEEWHRLLPNPDYFIMGWCTACYRGGMLWHKCIRCKQNKKKSEFALVALDKPGAYVDARLLVAASSNWWLNWVQDMDGGYEGEDLRYEIGICLSRGDSVSNKQGRVTRLAELKPRPWNRKESAEDYKLTNHIIRQIKDGNLRTIEQILRRRLRMMKKIKKGVIKGLGTVNEWAIEEVGRMLNDILGESDYDWCKEEQMWNLPFNDEEIEKNKTAFGHRSVLV